MTRGWFALCAVVALACAMLVTAVVHADAPTLVDRLVAIQPSLQSKRDQPVDATELAAAIVDVSKGNREWSALLLTVAAHESALSARIAGGGCRPKECDHGLAWSLWQIHANEQNAGVWGSTDLAVQTREASRMLRQAFYRCGGLHAGWELQTLRAFAGGSCATPFRGEAARIETLKRVRARL